MDFTFVLSVFYYSVNLKFNNKPKALLLTYIFYIFNKVFNTYKNSKDSYRHASKEPHQVIPMLILIFLINNQIRLYQL